MARSARVVQPPPAELSGYPAGVLEPLDSDGEDAGPHPRSPRHHEGVVLPSADGQTLGRLPEKRVTRTPDGLIDTVDGRPVNDFLKDVGRLRGEQIRQLRVDRVVSKGETGYATAVVLDRRTGEIFEVSNGGARTSVLRQLRDPARDRSALTENGEILGHVLRTQHNVRPVYVSAGHRMGHDQAADLVLALSRYRIPEPVRHADHLSRQALASPTVQ